jgi:hypothetical protein
MAEKEKIKSERLTLAQKKKNDYQWYKEKLDELDVNHYRIYSKGYNDVSDYKRMQVNYDLFNNNLNLSDFNHVCKPFGAEAGELPAQMVNRDISSGKIKAVLGMEKKRPFQFKVLATNSEATTRIEREEYTRIRQFVVDEVMKPIRQQVEKKYQEQLKGRELSQEEQDQLMQQMEQEITSQTPPEVRKYMEREHQDPSEVMAHQLLEFLSKKTDVQAKFNKAFKHLHLSAKEVLYIGIHNGHPEVWNVNSLRFNCDMSPDLDYIEDGEWATCEYRMTPSQVIQYFGDELSPKEIDDIYQLQKTYNVEYERESLFNFESYNEDDFRNTVRVIHGVWKALRPVKFLTYTNTEGEVKEKIVDESYKLNKEVGDIKIETEWIPECYEGWKIMDRFYVRMGPILGQFKDLNNLYRCKLPYYGAICDNLNSEPTCLMDRLKVYQYYFNIVMYRLELLLASDKGKKILMNINAIPDTDGMDIKKWQYFLESSPFVYYNPDEEGSSMDANTVAKVLDLSLISDIGKYIEIAEYLKKQAGESVGITPAVEGQTSPYESVGNNRTNIQASSNILEPYFDLHNHVKKNVLEALIETAKVAYHGQEVVTLSYTLDDLSRKVLNLDMGLLDNTTLGIFIETNNEAGEIKDMIKQLSFAAMQNQKVELSDVISVVKQSGIAEAEETLKVAEEERHQKMLEIEEKRGQQAKELEQMKEKSKQADHEREKDLIITKEEERRKTEIIKGSLVGASFNPDQDADNDGVNDFVELAREGLDADIKASKVQLDREKFEHQKNQDAIKNNLEEKKLKAAQAKKAQES